MDRQDARRNPAFEIQASSAKSSPTKALEKVRAGRLYATRGVFRGKLQITLTSINKLAYPSPLSIRFFFACHNRSSLPSHGK